MEVGFVGKIELDEQIIDRKFCSKVKQNILICQQYHPVLNVKASVPYCNVDGCVYTDCKYYKEGKKI